jgi:hypothetical protein
MTGLTVTRSQIGDFVKKISKRKLTASTINQSEENQEEHERVQTHLVGK